MKKKKNLFLRCGLFYPELSLGEALVLGDTRHVYLSDVTRTFAVLCDSGNSFNSQSVKHLIRVFSSISTTRK